MDDEHMTDLAKVQAKSLEYLGRVCDPRGWTCEIQGKCVAVYSENEAFYRTQWADFANFVFECSTPDIFCERMGSVLANAHAIEQLRRLGKLKAELDTLDDSIGKRLRSVEQSLHVLGLGVRIEIVIDTAYFGAESLLVFDKLNGKWRLFVEETSDRATPVTDTPRDFRAEVLQRHVPALLAAAVDQIRARIDSRRHVVSSTKQVLSALENLVASTSSESPR